MNRKRYIRQLSEPEQCSLQAMVKESAQHRERQRAQAILWSHQSQDMESILSLLKIDRDTLSSWFSRWENEGITGLKDKPRSGRPAASNEAEKKNS